MRLNLGRKEEYTMKRIKLTVAYDGTNYHGWQIQPKEVTVEAILNQTLSQLLKQEIQVIGASRTDAGVHAEGNVAVFDCETRIPAEKISFALNQRLPEDIVIRDSMEVAMDFHPRYCDCIKTYEYHIYNDKFLDPTKRLYTHFTHHTLDVKAMNEAASYIIGEHDFKSFCSAGAQVMETIRTVYRLKIEQREKQIIIKITGNGFLYNMVRIIAGTLIQVGRHSYPPSYVKEILLSKDRTLAGPTAPAKGLVLKEIRYCENIKMLLDELIF